MKRSKLAQSALFRKASRFFDHPWFFAGLGVLALVNNFTVLIPVEPLLLGAVFVQPKQWRLGTLWVALGSALGAFALAYLLQRHASGLALHFIPHRLHSPSWAHYVTMTRRLGFFGVGLLALAPLPQQAIIVAALLVDTSPLSISLQIGLSRALKYGLFSYITARKVRPSLLS